MNNKTNEEKEIVTKAEEVTIKYFKETEGLDVTITDHKFGQKDFQTILISGYVTNDKSKSLPLQSNTLIIIILVLSQRLIILILNTKSNSFTST